MEPEAEVALSLGLPPTEPYGGMDMSSPAPPTVAHPFALGSTLLGGSIVGVCEGALTFEFGLAGNYLAISASG